MRRLRPLPILILSLAIAFGTPVFAQEAAFGANVDSLINYAKTRNPEYAAMQAEAEASGERMTPAGALPDPKFRTELRDITRFGEQNATLVPKSRRQHPLPADAGYSLVRQARPEARNCRARGRRRQGSRAGHLGRSGRAHQSQLSPSFITCIATSN